MTGNASIIARGAQRTAAVALTRPARAARVGAPAASARREAAARGRGAT
jgi:hypothetical protein